MEEQKNQSKTVGKKGHKDNTTGTILLYIVGIIMILCAFSDASKIVLPIIFAITGSTFLIIACIRSRFKTHYKDMEANRPND